MLEKAFQDVYTKFKLHFYQNVFQRFATREATLTTVESFCMEGIMAMGEPTIAEFSRMMQISTPNAAYKIGSLVKKGYVEKIQSTTDRREYHLRPTQKYIDYYNISYSYLHTVVERARQRFTPEECAKLEQMLTIVSTELMPELDILKKARNKNDKTAAAQERAAAVLHISLQHHKQCAGGDEGTADEAFGGKGLVQHHKGQHKGDDHAELINGHYLGRCTHLQSVVVAQPACAGGKAGQHQKQPAAAGDLRNAGLSTGKEHHAPAHQQHHRRADGSGKGGVDPLDADFSQNRGKGSEHRRPQRVNEPHGKRLLFAPVYAFV